MAAPRTRLHFRLCLLALAAAVALAHAGPAHRRHRGHHPPPSDASNPRPDAAAAPAAAPAAKEPHSEDVEPAADPIKVIGDTEPLKSGTDTKITQHTLAENIPTADRISIQKEKAEVEKEASSDVVTGVFNSPVIDQEMEVKRDVVISDLEQLAGVEKKREGGLSLDVEQRSGDEEEVEKDPLNEQRSDAPKPPRPSPDFHRKNLRARPQVRPQTSDFIAENPLYEWTFPCSSQEKGCLDEERVLYDGDRQCYPLWRAGPCARGQWLVIDKHEALHGSGRFRAVCANMSRCASGLVLMASDGRCHALAEVIREVCPKHEGLQLSYNVFGEGECKCDNCPPPQLPSNTFNEGRCAFPPSFYRASAEVGLEAEFRVGLGPEGASQVTNPGPDPSPAPSSTSGPSSSPNIPIPSISNNPIPNPSNIPIPSPSNNPIPIPSNNPIPSPSHNPIPIPSNIPNPKPSESPIASPPNIPNPKPSESPIPSPSNIPNPKPSNNPIHSPSNNPITNPSNIQIPSPSNNPLPSPPKNPIPNPTKNPIPTPSNNPIPIPSNNPIPTPSNNPLPSPSKGTSRRPDAPLPPRPASPVISSSAPTAS